MNREYDILDERIKAHYEAQTTDANAIDDLKARIEAESPQMIGTARARRRWLRFSAAAALLLTGAVLIVYVTGALRDRVPTIASRVASEIALNHNKQLPPEFLVTEFSDLCAAMSKLGFTPVRPQRFTDAQYELVGARYCSIGGSNAALIQLRDDAGRVLTLYEFREEKSFESIHEADLDVNGVRVILWREADLIMGLAGSPS
ncbi:MAG: hypothetical protein V3T84_02685 [Phycisphaerales bacterium]